MPSPGRANRRWLELALRTGAFAVLGWALWLAARPALVSTSVERVTTSTLAERLSAWVLAGAPDSVRLSVDSLPDDSLLDWLVALRRAGTSVTWSGEIAPLALAVEPVNAPAGGSRLLVAAPGGSSVELRDAAGPVDTVRPQASGGAARVATLAEPAAAMLAGTVARAHATDSLTSGAILVLGTAGWEARYVIAALEESGWRVDARLTIAPELMVRRGTPGAIDAARYGAVIALDSAASGEARRLVAYVRSGGGVILGGTASGLPALRDIAPGVPGARVRPDVTAFTADAPRRALSFVAIGRLRDDALLLEARDGRSAVAARRVGLGRVLQVGYDESWRWRMQGGELGREAHRRWWADAVAATARRSATERTARLSPVHAAPRAAVIATLGQPTPDDATGRAVPPRRGMEPWMLVMSLGLLLAEWSSRRLRGAA
jgi:hypothetical protein